MLKSSGIRRVVHLLTIAGVSDDLAASVSKTALNTLELEAERFFETSVTVYQYSWRHIPEHLNFYRNG
jgi:hypothetical protein